MSIFSQVLEFAVGLDASNFKRAVGDLSGEAEKAAAGIGSAFGKANDAIIGLSDGTENARQRMDKFTDSARDYGDVGGELERTLIGVADISEVMGLGFEKNVRQVADMAGGIEGVVVGGSELISVLSRVGGIIGPLSVLLAAGATAWVVYKNAVGESETELDLLKDTADNLKSTLQGLTEQGVKAGNASWADLSKTLREAREDYGVLTGDIDENEVAIRRQNEAIVSAARAGILSAAQNVNAIEMVIAANEKLVAIARENNEENDEANAALALNRKALAGATDAVRERRDALEEVIGLTRSQIELETVQASASELVAEQDRAASDAAREYSRIQMEADRESERVAAEAATSREALIGITEQATLAALTGADAIIYAQNLQLSKIQELEDASNAHVQAELARNAVLMQTERELGRVRDDEFREYERELKDRQQMIESGLNQTLDVFADFADARLTGEESLGESLRDLGRSFLAGQLLDLAAKLATESAASFAALNLVAGAAFAAGSVIATAGAVTLSSGGVSTAAPASSSTGQSLTQEQAETHQQESTPATGSSSARTTASSSDGVTLVYKHRAFDAVVQDSLRVNGSALRTALDDTATPGRRAR